MKQRLFLFGFVFALFACVFVQASDVPRVFKEKLETRYKQRKVIVVPDKVLVGVIQTIDTICPVNYDHFHSSVSMPKSYERRNNLDDRTTEQVEEGSGKMESLEPGEVLTVSKIWIEKVHRFGFYGVDIFLKTLSGKRQNAYGKALGVSAFEQKNYGVHFRFAFAPELIERGDYDTVVAEINKYLLPAAEYKQASEAQTKVEIQPGMSKENVIKALGEPLKTITFGKKTILKYQDLTIELEENKVVEVKAN